MGLRGISVRDAGGVPPPGNGLRHLSKRDVRRISRGWLSIAGALMLFAAAPETCRAELAVARWAFARGIEGREPVGESATFPADVGALFFFTQVIGADPPTEISHVWIYGGKDVAVIPLAVEASSWRTWSRKKVPSDQPGVWTVEVRGPEGVVLLTATCKVE
jgi:hypothetical protein